MKANDKNTDRKDVTKPRSDKYEKDLHLDRTEEEMHMQMIESL